MSLLVQFVCNEMFCRLPRQTSFGKLFIHRLKSMFLSLYKSFIVVVLQHPTNRRLVGVVWMWSASIKFSSTDILIVNNSCTPSSKRKIIEFDTARSTLQRASRWKKILDPYNVEHEIKNTSETFVHLDWIFKSRQYWSSFFLR